MGTSEGNEDVFHALQEFVETPQSQRQTSSVLDDALEKIATTGDLHYPWALVRPVIEHKLQAVLREFFESTAYPNRDEAEREHAEMKDTIFSRLGWFDRAPFTVQRLCELVVWPKRHYTRCDKYMRGLTKVIKVVSTVGPPTCNGSAHSTSTETCNGNGTVSSPLTSRRESATNGEASNMNLSTASSVSSLEPDDSFPSFSLSPRQMPSPYSPPLSPTGFDNRTVDDPAPWRSPVSGAVRSSPLSSGGVSSTTGSGSTDRAADGERDSARSGSGSDDSGGRTASAPSSASTSADDSSQESEKSRSPEKESSPADTSNVDAENADAESTPTTDSSSPPADPDSTSQEDSDPTNSSE